MDLLQTQAIITIKKRWIHEPDNLWKAIKECGVERSDSLCLWLVSSELVLRKHWNGNLAELQDRYAYAYSVVCPHHIAEFERMN